MMRLSSVNEAEAKRDADYWRTVEQGQLVGLSASLVEQLAGLVA
jgi:hypothetical protein